MLQVSCRRGSHVRLGSKQDQPQTVPVFIFILDKQRVDSVSSPVESRQKQSQNGKKEARCRGGQQGGDSKYGRIHADSAKLREPIRARHFQLGKSRLQLFNLTSSLFFPSFNSSSLLSCFSLVFIQRPRYRIITQRRPRFPSLGPGAMPRQALVNPSPST